MNSNNTHSPTSLPTRRTRRNRRTLRRHIIAGAGVLTAATVVAVSGFAIQNAIDQAASEHAAEMASAVNQQRDMRNGAAKTAARASAATILAQANDVISAVNGKVDTEPLAASVASLGDYIALDSEEVVDRTTRARSALETVKAAADEADRKAAADEQARLAANEPSAAKSFAQQIAASQYGWGADQFSCLDKLWTKESGWRASAKNSSSAATGIPQALPGSKMATFGDDWASNAQTQIRWGLSYIASGSYKTPCAAWAHSQAVGWY